jgi:hypothetical protein
MENAVIPDTGNEAAPESAPEREPPTEAGNGERGRSTISFPYAAMPDGERIAEELYKYGGSATPEGIARVLGQKARSGAFRQKLSAARIFGFITTRPGQVMLSKLGRSVIDPEKQARARTEAFLNVPLYRAIFDKYQGDLLPPAATLDAEMTELGVSPKQASLARQIMFRSAEHAGFFASGPNRLVAPDGEAGAPPPGARAPLKPQEQTGSLPPALAAPVLAMLDTGESWTPQQTHEYVDALRKMRRALGGT